MNRIYEDIKKAKGYGRLSDEDRDKRNFSMESNSISSQRTIIEQFCDEKNIINTGYYYDDGITGQTFERDGWNQLIRDIEAGLVDCVITKDLSRLGRDHTETGYYIEKYFPEHKIRYISINDNWDSKYDSVDLILWKLAYNDVYCADISRKIKSNLNSKKRLGLYMGSFAPFGYVKNKEDKHYLEVDEQTGYIVKEIFELAYSGLGTTKIANILNEKKYITPGAYCKRVRKDRRISDLVGEIWTTGMVRRILTNEVYMGDLTQCKIKKASYKSKKTIRNERSDWIIVRDTHEPLVSREVFESIQKMLELSQKKYTRLPGEKHLLGKLLHCKDCQHRIAIAWKNPKKHEQGRNGVCNFYKKYSKHKVCTPHYIDYDELETQVISYIKMISRKYIEKIDTPSFIKDNYKNLQEKIREKELQSRRNKNELEKAEVFMMKLYEDKLNGDLDLNIYRTLSEKKSKELDIFREQQKKIEKDIALLHEKLDKDKHKYNDIKNILNGFLNSELITQDLIHQIIKRIDVGENNEIDVLFNIEELAEFKV